VFKVAIGVAFSVLIGVVAVLFGFPRLYADHNPPETVRVVEGRVAAHMTAAGVLVPKRFHNVYFSGVGRVVSVDASLHSRVIKGTVLARLDSGQLTQAVRRRELELRRAYARLEDKRSNMGADDALGLTLAELDWEQAAFELKVAKEQLAQVEVRAPATGAIAHVGVRPGDNAAASGSMAPFVIVEDDNYVVEIEGDEGDIRRAHSGSRAIIYFAPPDAVTIPGSVLGPPVLRRIGTVTSGASTVLALSVALDRNPSDIQIGRAARVEIEISSRGIGPVVPLRALFRNGSEESVLVSRHGRWVPERVTIGLTDDSLAELQSGPPVGSLVAVGTSDRLRELAGQPQPR
jgi:multidrug efflux pump subunit AcrA (membrane-fusion protein)